MVKYNKIKNLISLDKKDPNNLSKNENMDNKYNNVIQATEKLGEIFYDAFCLFIISYT